MSLKFTILGCGSSGGVPRPALGWGDCNPNNPKNRRRRTSFLVERRASAGVTRVLVDTSPDLREQLLEAQMRFELGELTEEEFADIERDVLARIREIKGAARGPLTMSPTDKISGVDVQSYEEHER